MKALMRQISIAFILVLGSCDGALSILDLEGPQHSPSSQGNQGPIGQQGLKSDISHQVLQAHQPPQQLQGRIDMQNSAVSPVTAFGMPGGSASTAGASCQALLDAGVTLSGAYWVKNPTPADPSQVGLPMGIYCDQDVNGGGWALVYNSVLGANTLDFWNIPYAQRLGRRGRPSIDSNYYDGSLYQTAAATYMDVIEDLRGNTVIAFIARTAGINNVNMRFSSPVLLSGDFELFTSQFASGWSAPDYDGDVEPTTECALYYNNVTQHYSRCWAYNLGSDADVQDGETTDQRLGPHVHKTALDSLGATGDGSGYGRVRAIRRYVKW